LYAESGSYSEVESQSASQNDDDLNWTILGPIVGVAIALVIATLTTVTIIYCYCHSNRDKKSSVKSPANDFIVVHKYLIYIASVINL